MTTTTRLDRDHVARLIDYHHWAADLAFGAVSDLSASDLDEKWGGSFGTGRGLLQHVLGAERLWVDRWNRKPAAGLPSFPATHSGADFRAEWERLRAEQRRFIDSVPQDALGRELTYTNIRGQVKSFRLDDIILQVVNHGTYHRGQISHLLRDRGRNAPSTDMMFFFDAEIARRGSA